MGWQVYGAAAPLLRRCALDVDGFCVHDVYNVYDVYVDVYADVRRCTPLYADVHRCTPMYTDVHRYQLDLGLMWTTES